MKKNLNLIAMSRQGITMPLKHTKMTYQLDDETKAKQFQGKQVNEGGTMDKSTSVIRVTRHSAGHIVVV